MKKPKAVKKEKCRPTERNSSFWKLPKLYPLANGTRHLWQVAHDSRNLSIASKSGASMTFKRIMERAGVAAGIARKAEEGSSGHNVSARSFHSLRHTYVTALSAAGVAVELRQRLAGHASEAQSLHYTHPAFAALRDAVEKLPGLRTL